MTKSLKLFLCYLSGFFGLCYLSSSPLALNISQHQGLFEIFLLEVSYCQMHRKQNKEVILLTHFQGQTIVTYDAI